MIVRREWAHFRSLKWGRSKPGAVLWWVATPMNQFVVVAEMKFTHLDAPELKKLIDAKQAALGFTTPVRYTAAEPLMWKSDVENGPTLAESFARAGLPLMQVSGERIQGWNHVASLMKASVNIDGIQNPSLIVSESCEQLRRLIPLLREGQGLGVNAAEDIDQKTETSLADALRIGAMSRPAATFYEAPKPSEDQMGAALERARRESMESSNSPIFI